MNFSQSGTHKAELAPVVREDEPISFPHGRDSMETQDWSGDVRARRRYVIVAFLDFCKRERRPASSTSIKSHLAELQRNGRLIGEAREALRWFVIEWRRQQRSGEPGAVT